MDLIAKAYVSDEDEQVECLDDTDADYSSSSSSNDEGVIWIYQFAQRNNCFCIHVMRNAVVSITGHVTQDVLITNIQDFWNDARFI